MGNPIRAAEAYDAALCIERIQEAVDYLGLLVCISLRVPAQRERLLGAADRRAEELVGEVDDLAVTLYTVPDAETEEAAHGD